MSDESTADDVGPVAKRKVLFVDDEQAVLAGLKRMLRSARHDWDMTFVDSGTRALEELGLTDYDAIVSDMRMPDMDGAEIFERIQTAHPGAVRIILSGHSELESTMRSVSCAHQFLAKPCEPDKLRATVARSCELRQSLADPALEAAVGKIDSLPALPRVYNQLVSAMADPDVSMDEITAIVSMDPGIAVKLIQLVNSSFFGIARQISSIRDAITFLGLSTIKTLTLNHEVFQAFDATQAAQGFDIESAQTHSLAVATLAQSMLDDPAQADLAFLGGVLHDIGKLVLATCWREQYEQVLRLAATSTAVPLHVLERRAIKVTHGDVGAYLLGIWGMPHPIVEAAHKCHMPGSLPVEAGFDSVAAVQLADALVHEALGDQRSVIDLEFLRAVGVEARLPEWREFARSIVQSQADEAA